jgi:hypothetical protein
MASISFFVHEIVEMADHELPVPVEQIAFHAAHPKAPICASPPTLLGRSFRSSATTSDVPKPCGNRQMHTPQAECVAVSCISTGTPRLLAQKRNVYTIDRLPVYAIVSERTRVKSYGEIRASTLFVSADRRKKMAAARKSEHADLMRIAMQFDGGPSP